MRPCPPWMPPQAVGSLLTRIGTAVHAVVSSTSVLVLPFDTRSSGNLARRQTR